MWRTIFLTDFISAPGKLLSTEATMGSFFAFFFASSSASTIFSLRVFSPVLCTNAICHGVPVHSESNLPMRPASLINISRVLYLTNQPQHAPVLLFDEVCMNDGFSFFFKHIHDLNKITRTSFNIGVIFVDIFDVFRATSYG